MGGGQQPQAPQYDPTQSTQATRDQLQAQYDFMAPMARLAGRLSTDQTFRNIAGTVNILRAPQSVYSARIADLERDSAANPQNKASNDETIARLRNRDPVTDIREAYADAYETADLLGNLTRQQAAQSQEYKRAQDALRAGVDPRLASTVSPDAAGVGRARDVSATRANAQEARFVNRPETALARGVADVSATEVGAGAVGNALMDEALGRVRNAGKLSAEANRDAVQAARRGMAARGMATGSAGLAAELLNRDRYSRQRGFEDMAFAQGVQSQDLERRFTNTANRLRADQQNQQIGAQMSLANQSAINQGRAMGYQGAIQQRQFNAAQENAMRQQFAADALRADLSNQGADQTRNLALSQNQQQANVLGAQLATQNNQFNAQQRTGADLQNIAYLQAGSALANQEGARRMGTLQDLYNFQFQTDPRSVMLTGSPFANLAEPGMRMASNAQFTPMYSGGQFSGGGFNLAGAGMGALSGAASGALIGSVVPGIGTAAGAIGGGLIGGLGGGLSDKREKTDIKKIDGPTNVIGIPAYEYRYKGEKKKRKGVMAQDVQKVLPEAVAEIDYKGKKRLAIKPAIIGAALAEQLAADTKPVALAS